MRSRVKYQIIYMNRKRYPVSMMCGFFGVSRSGYYGYVKRLDQPAHDAVHRKSATKLMDIAVCGSGCVKRKKYIEIQKQFCVL